MEIFTRPGMGSDSSCDISNQMKPQPAALGFRVKSGWAVAVLLTGPACSPQLCDVQRIDLSAPRLPETRQPYHAAMGKLETDTTEINRRVRIVRSIAQQSIAALFAGYRWEGYAITRAALVVGSQVDPDSIANPHIRAHALEGQLFRSVLEEALQTCHIPTQILVERNAYAQAAARLKESNENVRRVIQNLGRSGQGSWRAEQKQAALAAWLALC
jgi:hypothetical protein